VILGIKLEDERFNQYKQKAWERDNQLLTEQGLDLMEEAFVGVDIREFRISITKEETCVLTCPPGREGHFQY
jgi:hypothetical protein